MKSVPRFIRTFLRLLPFALLTLHGANFGTNAQTPAPKGHVVQNQGKNCGNNGDACDVIFESHPHPKETVWEILQPNVVQAQTSYPMIKFKPGDQIKIYAGGCVQTGGSGSTWKLYTAPQGDNSNSLYSGTIYIPGVIPEAANQYPRIGGYLYEIRGRTSPHYQFGPTLTIPQTLPPAMKPDDLYLRLGYQDDQYSDNGYYSHDDGNNNQCLNVGAAWVEIRVTSNDAKEPEYSPHFKPFDLVWEENDDLDGNWLPLNPKWTTQLGALEGAPVPIPNFLSTCQAAFPSIQAPWGLTFTGDINQPLLAQHCTSQSPTLDPHGFSFFDAFGMCHADPLGGHLNWSYATYKGTIYWVEASGSWPNDNDINLSLEPDHSEGLTTLNNGMLGLEFDSQETINNFHDPWWQPGVIGTSMNGRPAVVTGLVGIDGVHGGYTEIHPVFALAIWTDEKASGDGMDDTWQFFIRNSGDEGGCSQYPHTWSGINDTSNGNPWYYLDIPWRKGGRDFRIVHSEVWTSQPGIKGPTTVKGPDWTYVGFQMPGPDAAEASVDGEITIHYKVSQDILDGKTKDRDSMKKGHADEDADFASIIAKIPDPAVRKKVMDWFAANNPNLHTGKPHKFPGEAGKDQDALKAIASVRQEDVERLRHDKTKADPAQQAALADFEKKLKAFFPPNVKITPPSATDLNKQQ